MGGLVVRREQISIIACCVTSGANELDTVGVVRSDGEAELVKQRSDQHVDLGHVEPNGRCHQGVLELHDIGLIGGCGDLDRDTTTIEIETPLLRIAPSSGYGNHCPGDIAGRP